MEIKAYGDWTHILSAFRFHEARWNALQRRIMRDFTREFRRAVKDKIPSTPSTKAYRASLTTQEVTGFGRGEIAYAVVADPKSVPISDIKTENTVFFYEQTGEQATELGAFYAEGSPWTFDFMPEVMIRLGLLKVKHVKATSDEFKRIVKKNSETLKENREFYQRAESQIKLKYKDAIKRVEGQEEKSPLESTPDWLFQAMRWEFGIGGKQIAHWRPAIRGVDKITKKLIQRHGKVYSRYLIDSKFRDWTTAERKLKRITMQKFKSRYGKFAEKVTR
jgi:hypothetical protein